MHGSCKSTSTHIVPVQNQYKTAAPNLADTLISARAASMKMNSHSTHMN